MYVKLFGSILDSSIWFEPDHVLRVWLVMLVRADETGFVKGVEAAIAERARVERKLCREALTTLESPDIESQDQDYGGRRIEKREGGWQVLNYTKYREIRTRSQVLAAHRAARHRQKNGAAKSASDNDDRDASRSSRPVTPIATASASQEVLELPRAREADESPHADAPDPMRALLAAQRERGPDTSWCTECGGVKVQIQGDVHLRHQSWCSRRMSA